MKAMPEDKNNDIQVTTASSNAPSIESSEPTPIKGTYVMIQNSRSTPRIKRCLEK